MFACWLTWVYYNILSNNNQQKNRQKCTFFGQAVLKVSMCIADTRSVFMETVRFFQISQKNCNGFVVLASTTGKEMVAGRTYWKSLKSPSLTFGVASISGLGWIKLKVFAFFCFCCKQDPVIGPL